MLGSTCLRLAAGTRPSVCAGTADVQSNRSSEASKTHLRRDVAAAATAPDNASQPISFQIAVRASATQPLFWTGQPLGTLPAPGRDSQLLQQLQNERNQGTPSQREDTIGSNVGVDPEAPSLPDDEASKMEQDPSMAAATGCSDSADGRSSSRDGMNLEQSVCFTPRGSHETRNALNRRLQRCANAREVRTLVAAAPEACDAVNLSTALQALARVERTQARCSQTLTRWRPSCRSQ